MGDRVIFQEEYLCDHFSFIVTYRSAPTETFDVLLSYFERHTGMTFKDTEGMTKALERALVRARNG